MEEAYGTGQHRGEAEVYAALREVENVADLLFQQGSQEVQMCQIYRSSLGTLDSEYRDRNMMLAAAHERILLANEEARLHSANYQQARGELASSYAQAVKQREEHLAVQQHWQIGETELNEEIGAVRQQARSYEEQVRTEAQRYRREMMAETEAARTELRRVEDRAVRELAQANAQQLAACAETMRESGIATSLSS
jgi:hypothetical protein